MTVVLLHPIGLDGDCWQLLQSKELNDALRYDLLWHGGRPEPAEALSLETMADDVAQNTNGPLDVVGLSMGGGVAFQLAFRHPERVRSLLIACANAGGGDTEVYRQRALDTERLGMSGALELNLPRWFTPAALSAPSHVGVDYVRNRLLDDDPRSFAASWLALGANNALARLHELELPVTVLHATGDAPPVSGKQEMVNRLKNGRLVVIPGPHFVHLENPDVFEHEVLEHLKWVH